MCGVLWVGFRLLDLLNVVCVYGFGGLICWACILVVGGVSLGSFCCWWSWFCLEFLVA